MNVSDCLLVLRELLEDTSRSDSEKEALSTAIRFIESRSLVSYELQAEHGAQAAPV